MVTTVRGRVAKLLSSTPTGAKRYGVDTDTVGTTTRGATSRIIATSRILGIKLHDNVIVDVPTKEIIRLA